MIESTTLNLPLDLQISSYSPPARLRTSPNPPARQLDVEALVPSRSPARELLDSVATQVLRDAEQSSQVCGGLELADVRTASALVLAELERYERDGSVECPTTNIPLALVIDAFRVRFVAAAAAALPELDASRALRILAGIEQLRAVVQQNTAQLFSSRLSGHDALQLLVEVAHDMRSPLASAMFLAEQIRSGNSGPLTPLQDRQLCLIYGAAHGLGGLVNDMVELVQGGERILDRTPVPFSLHELLESVLRVVRPIAEEKQLKLTAELPDVSPVLGRPAALGRVLTNLTTNCLKYTPEGCVEVVVRQVVRNRFEFSVRDTGLGIPDSVLRQLFDSFRARRGHRSYAFSSSGLGLAISQQLLEKMGSTLQVDSEMGRGTCFSFVLDMPLAPRISGPTIGF